MAVWTETLTFLPDFTHGEVEIYSKSFPELAPRKVTKGYQKFIEGFIHDIQSEWLF